MPAALLALDGPLAFAERTLLRHTWRVVTTRGLLHANVLFAVAFGFPSHSSKAQTVTRRGASTTTFL